MPKDYLIINEHIKAEISGKGIAGIQKTDDLNRTEFIMPGERFGAIDFIYVADGEEYGFSSADADFEAEYIALPFDSYRICFSHRSQHIDISVTYRLDGDILHQDILLRNHTAGEIRIRDFSTHFPSNARFLWGESPAGRTLNHCFVGGHGSFVYTVRCDGQPPYLLSMPTGNTKFEFFDILSR